MTDERRPRSPDATDTPHAAGPPDGARPRSPDTAHPSGAAGPPDGGRLSRAGDAAGPPRSSRRLEREEHTLAAMIAMYCRDHHGATGAIGEAGSAGSSAPAETAAGPVSVATSNAAAGPASLAMSNQCAGPLCSDCTALLDYARARLAHCPYGADKPTCANCPTHCYELAKRERVRAVMRHSGPRMLKEHPLMAAVHLIDGRRRPPDH